MVCWSPPPIHYWASLHVLMTTHLYTCTHSVTVTSITAQPPSPSLYLHTQIQVASSPFTHIVKYSTLIHAVIEIFTQCHVWIERGEGGSGLLRGYTVMCVQLDQCLCSMLLHMRTWTDILLLSMLCQCNYLLLNSNSGSRQKNKGRLNDWNH